MGWRFRQSFKVIPGLRLNLSRSGLSASIGGAPFTLNIGPHGVTGTEAIPGTGISYREHVNFAQPRHELPNTPNGHGSSPAAPFSLPMPPSLSTTPIEQVRSASTELLTSESLKELKKLMLMTFQEHEDISQQWRRLDQRETSLVRGMNRGSTDLSVSDCSRMPSQSERRSQR